MRGRAGARIFPAMEDDVLTPARLRWLRRAHDNGHDFVASRHVVGLLLDYAERLERELGTCRVALDLAQADLAATRGPRRGPA